MSDYRFGRVDYSTITTPNEERKWYYSNIELQDKLNNLCKNHTLKKVYADLRGYLESLHQDDNYYDFSYFGGPVILIFDNIAIELCVHVEGMIQCREINLWDIKIKNTHDYPPNEMHTSEKYFYDLSEQFQLKYEEQIVTEIVVDNTNTYGFSLNGFDKEKAKKAEETNSLPNNVHFYLANGVDFGVYADYIEYFYIELKTYN